MSLGMTGVTWSWIFHSCPEFLGCTGMYCSESWSLTGRRPSFNTLPMPRPTGRSRCPRGRLPVRQDIARIADVPPVAEEHGGDGLEIELARGRPIGVAADGKPLLGKQREDEPVGEVARHHPRSRLPLALPGELRRRCREDEGRPRAEDPVAGVRGREHLEQDHVAEPGGRLELTGGRLVRDDIVDRDHRPCDEVPVLGEAYGQHGLELQLVVPVIIGQPVVVELKRQGPQAGDRVTQLLVQFARRWASAPGFAPGGARPRRALRRPGLPARDGPIRPGNLRAGDAVEPADAEMVGGRGAEPSADLVCISCESSSAPDGIAVTSTRAAAAATRHSTPVKAQPEFAALMSFPHGPSRSRKITSARAARRSSLLKRENGLPVILHADHGRALLRCLVVQRLGERADLLSGSPGQDRRHTRASRRRAAPASSAAHRLRPWCTRASAGRRSSCRRRRGRRPIIRWMASGLPA